MQKRFNDKECEMIKALFDTDEKLKLMRKVFLPELTQDAPIAGNETLLSYIRTEDMTSEEIAVEVKSVMKMIRHIEAALSMAQMMNTNAPASASQIAQKIKKDSLK